MAECTLQTVSHAMLAACSQEYTQVKQAEHLILELELKPKFFPILAELCMEGSVPVEVKRMSAICLKNGVSKFWRSMSPNSLGKEDKERIKTAVVRSHNEESKEVFEQMLEVVAKISRYEFPKTWPDFIPIQIQVLESGQTEGHKLRALSLIYKVIKMLSTKRLSADKTSFRETSNGIFVLIGSVWETYLGLLNKDPSLLHLQPALVALKLLRAMLTYGFEDISAPLPKSCLEVILKLAAPQLLHRLSLDDTLVCHLYDKYLLVLVKTLITVQERFPDSFGQYMLVSLQFADQIAFQHSERLDLKLVARSLHLLSGIMLCETYDVFKLNNRGKDVSSETIRFTEMRNSFFTEEKLKEMCVTCISKYQKLTEDELLNWQESPEEFAFEETRHVSLFSIKAASEHFLLNTTSVFQDTVCPYIISLINECGKHDRSNLDTVLVIDSIYAVTVICSYDLFDYIDIEAWFKTLVTELRVDTPYCSILKRRILEVIGRWVTIKLSQDQHPAVYEVCIEHMKESQDLVVRLTAASALKAALTDFAFYPPAYSSYLEVTVELLYNLLKQVQECESRVKVLEVVNSIIDGCGYQITSFVDPLIGWLPQLWEAAVDHFMLQTQLLHTARKLTKCLGAESCKLYHFINPVLKYALTQEPQLVLLEDGLSLWLTVLEHAPASTPDLVLMFEWLYPLIQLGSASVKTSLLIIECTILLDPPSILSRYGAGLVGACTTLYPDVVGESKVLITNIILAIIKTTPRQQWPDLTPLLHVTFKDLHSNYSKVVTVNLNVICYLILLDMTYFNNLLSSFNINNILPDIFKVWLSQSEHFYQIEQYKLSLLALLKVVTHQPVLMQRHFKEVIELIEKSVQKCTDLDENGVRFDCLVTKHSSSESHNLTGESSDYKRRRIVESADILSKIDTIIFLRAKFSEIRQAVGAEAFNELSVTVDQKVTNNLTKYLTL